MLKKIIFCVMIAANVNVQAIDPLSGGIIAGVAFFVGRKVVKGIRSLLAPSIVDKSGGAEYTVESQKDPLLETTIQKTMSNESIALEKEKQSISHTKKIADLRNEILSLWIEHINGKPDNKDIAAALRDKMGELSTLIGAQAFRSFIAEAKDLVRNKVQAHV
jgi:hypothetical protein